MRPSFLKMGFALSTLPVWRRGRAIFTLTTGRTGTDTLTRLLALSDLIDAHHEPLPKLIPERKRAREEVYQNMGRYRRIFVQARGGPLLKAVLIGKIYAETSPKLTFFAPVIADLLPRAKFIYLHRHPAEVVRSGMRRLWYQGHEHDEVRIRPACGEKHFEEWSSWDAFTKNCWSWHAYNEFALDFLSHMEQERVLNLSSEDLYSGEATPGIFQFIGTPEPSANDVQEVLRRKHNAQVTHDFPKYAAWSEEQQAVLYAVAGETMSRLGYS